MKALDDFPLARALEHDCPTLLVQLACDHLWAERVVRPGVVTLMRRVAAARERAWEEAYDRLQPLLVGPARRAQLDWLLEPDPALGAVPLVWLRRGATAASAQAIKAELAKLDFVRSLGGDRLDLSAIPVGQRRFLTSLGRRSRVQALARAGVHRRYPVLLATLAETAVEVLDELVELFDQALAGADRRARAQLAERALERAQSVEDRLDLLYELTAVLTTPPSPTRRLGDSCASGSGWTGCGPPAAPTPNDGRATAATWSCSRPATRTCASSPPASSPL